MESNNGRIIIKSGGRNYSFFQTKQDGTKSRAQSDFEKLGVSIGQTYSFGITETQGTNPKTGAPVVYKNIVTISPNSPQTNSPSPVEPTTQYPNYTEPTTTTQAPVTITYEEFSRLADAVNALTAKLGELDKQVHGLRLASVDNEKAIDFHAQTQDVVEQNKADQIPTIDLDEEINPSDVPF
ncbi:MAG: hypothetical protein WCR65_02450 [Parcubacteria group bacterium]